MEPIVSGDYKVLVTGANGQLGTAIKKSLIKKIKDKYIFVTREEFDICDKHMMRNYLLEHKDIKVIINCAAYTNVRKAEEEKELAMRVNCDAVKDLAELCKEFDIFLIHFGTDYMYQYNNTAPINEDICYFSFDDNWFGQYYWHSINTYGLSKLGGVKRMFDTFPLENHKPPKFVVIVVSWLFSEFGNNFANTMFNKILNDEECGVVCTEIGSPTYAVDLAEFVIDSIEERGCNFVGYGEPFVNSQRKCIINFSNLGIASWYDVAKYLEVCLNRGELQHNSIKPRLEPFDNIKRPNYSVLDTTRLLKLYDKKPYVRHWTSAIDSYVFNRFSLKVLENQE